MMVFHWSLSDSKFSRVTKTLLSILTEINNGVVGMLLIHLQISNFSRSIFKLLETVPSALLTISITVTLMFHRVFSSLLRSKYLSLLSWSAGMA